jgi:hypothetical protein
MTTTAETARRFAGAFFKHSDSSGDLARHEIQELTTQFYVTLRASVARVHENGNATSLAEIRDLLNRPGKPSWSGAYEVEQRLVDVIDDRILDVELQARLLEARSTLKPALVDHYAERVKEGKTVEDRRAVLARLINDLQWRYTVNEVKRAYSKEITGRTGVIFISAIAAFALTVITLTLSGTQLSQITDTRPLLLLLAAVAGAWGAGFSMLSSLKSRLDEADLDDLKLMKARSTLWSRPLIGVGAACILYFFLSSGLLSGSAFPVLEPTGASSTTTTPSGTPTAPQTQSTVLSPHLERKQLALLIVWCFLAGFSERLVPALLAKTEDDRIKPSQQGTTPPDRTNRSQRGENERVQA